MIVAIDGPAASGKSTTAKLLAKEFNLLYIDTGAMYRAVALHIKNNGIDVDNLSEIKSMLERINIEFKFLNQENIIFLNGVDVSVDIRSPEISKLSSKIAVLKIIREKMVEMQRKLSLNQSVILDGRDIGTVVFPEAEFKFFLTATLEIRALRRHDELIQKGLDVELEAIKQDLMWRDANDIERDESPLKKTDDALEINTTEMTIEEQVRIISKVIREKIA